MTLIFFTLAVLMGVVAARQSTPSLTALVAGDAVAALFAAWAWRADRARQVAVICAGLALGATRCAVGVPRIDAGHVAAYNDSGNVILRAWVAEQPDIRGARTLVTVEALALDGGGEELPVHGRVVANVFSWPAVEYGDVLEIEGALQTPPEGEEFSYRQYLAERGVLAWMPRARARVVGARPGLLVATRRAGGRLKTYLRGVINSILPNPEAGLLNGMLLGLGHTLPDDVETAFRRSGLTHIIVISGYNIGLVLTLFLLGRGLVRYQVTLLIGMVAIGIYSLFVGTSPPVARAALMGILFALGTLLGRRSHSLTALAFATLVMVAANPYILWSVSFQLSAGATLGLLVMERRLGEALSALAERRGTGWQRAAGIIREGLLATVAAQAATLPIIWYHFAEVSVISLAANVLVLSIQPLVLIGGVLATLAGCVALPLGRAAGWLVWPALRYTLAIVEGLGSLPWASVAAPTLTAGEVWVTYAVLAVAIALVRGSAAPSGAPHSAVPLAPAGGEPSTGRASTVPATQGGAPAGGRGSLYGLGALALVAAAVWGAAIGMPDGRAHVTFLDVGQGDAVLIRSASGRTILVDGGPDPTTLLARLGRALPFWERRIDLVVATHADGDHLTGLLPVLEHYEVGAALESPAMAPGALTDEWERALAANEVPCATAWRGARIEVSDGLLVEVLHPPDSIRPPANADLNPLSLVLRVTAAGQSVLLTADVDAATEQALITGGLPLTATALKAAHHGAATATSDAFLEAVRPSVAVISVGAENTYGHPAPATLERLRSAGASVWRTDACGAVDLVLDPDGLRVRTARECTNDGARTSPTAR